MGSHPFACGLALFLEATLDHQLHSLITRHTVDMNGGVDNRIRYGPQVPLQVNQAHQRIVIQVAFVDHHALGVDRPAFDEGP